MSKTILAEYAEAKVPGPVWVARPRHTGVVENNALSNSEGIGSDRAFLKVVAYPWGVEFEVRSQEEGI